MNLSQAILLLTVALTAGLGAAVLLANPRRHQNRAFFTLACTLALWGSGIFAVSTSNDRAAAEFILRLTCYVSVLIPVVLHIFCRSILSPGMPLRKILHSIRFHILISQTVGVLIFTPWFVTKVKMPGDPGFLASIPVPVFGGAWHVMNAYIATSLLAVIGLYARRVRHTSGILRAELQFLLMGSALAVVIALSTQIIIPLFSGSTYTQHYGPISLLLMNIVLAYGIATRRMLDIPTVLQRASAFLVLVAYLTLLYAALFFGLLFLFGEQARQMAHYIAALAMAFSVSPMAGVFQKVARNLILTTQHRDISRIVRASRIRFATLSTVEDIFDQLGDIFAQGGLDPDRIQLVLLDHDSFVEQIPQHSTDEPLRLSLTAPLASYLQNHPNPIAEDTISRGRASPELSAALAEMQSLQVKVAIGLFSKQMLRGILLLSRRRSGRIYSSADQDALQMMCDQMATALENAQLYTELQNSKRYSETILDNLVSGVIAVGQNRRITTFNREAQRITGLKPAALLNRDLSELPPPIATAFSRVLEEETTQSETEDVLQLTDGMEVPVRIGSSLFRGHSGKVLGAIVVFNDMTRVKALESQVRRSDRLASIGTLSAGMAHEIKNPLVTIKTFTQLLPERYQDEDFRETFSDLISHEVNRIDSIVNQLLHFSRPSKPVLEPRSLHELVHASLRLVNEQLRQHDIRLVPEIEAEQDTILADSDLLTQALINFVLNAIQSMGRNGILTISTHNISPAWSPVSGLGNQGTTGFIRLEIRDTGCGIPDEVLSHIFDPFFTTKDEGTGLGLSVAHGIITDHNGSIDVESEPSQGTVFRIFFPVHQEAAVAS